MKFTKMNFSSIEFFLIDAEEFLSLIDTVMKRYNSNGGMKCMVVRRLYFYLDFVLYEASLDIFNREK